MYDTNAFMATTILRGNLLTEVISVYCKYGRTGLLSHSELHGESTFLSYSPPGPAQSAASDPSVNVYLSHRLKTLYWMGYLGGSDT